MSYSFIQDRLLDDDRIATIIVESITPLRIGGYNAKPFSRKLKLMEKPRVQSLKGVWRWWARALIAGALLSLGEEDINISRLNEKLNFLFGYTKYASKINLFIRDIEEKSYIEGVRLKNIPRINLLLQSREREDSLEERYYKELSFKVDLIKRMHTSINLNEKNFAISSLVLALTLGGLGSIQTRGLGKFKVILDDKTKSENLELGKILDKIYNSENLETLTNSLESLVNLACKYTWELLGINVDSEKLIKPKKSLVPAIVPNAPHIFRLEAVKLYEDPIDALIHVGNATLKVNWKERFSDVGKNIHTWILGLPRQSRVKGKITGYSIDSSPGRRLSSIGFSILKLRTRYAVVMYGFISVDMLDLLKGLRGKRLIYRSGKLCPLDVLKVALKHGVQAPRYKIYRNVNDAEELLNSAFDVAWNAIKKFLEA